MKRQFLLFAFLFFLLAVPSAGETRQTISLNGVPACSIKNGASASN